MKKVFSWIVARFDRSDLQFFVGLLLLAYGISLLSVPWAFIVTGKILIIVAYSNEAVRQIATILAAARGNRK